MKRAGRTGYRCRFAPAAAAAATLLFLMFSAVPLAAAGSSAETYDDLHQKALEMLRCEFVDRGHFTVKNVGGVPAAAAQIAYRISGTLRWQDINPDVVLAVNESRTFTVPPEYQSYEAIAVLSARGLLYPVLEGAGTAETTIEGFTAAGAPVTVTVWSDPKTFYITADGSGRFQLVFKKNPRSLMTPVPGKNNTWELTPVEPGVYEVPDSLLDGSEEHTVRAVAGDANRNGLDGGGWNGYAENEASENFRVGDYVALSIPLRYDPFDLQVPGPITVNREYAEVRSSRIASVGDWKVVRWENAGYVSVENAKALMDNPDFRLTPVYVENRSYDWVLRETLGKDAGEWVPTGETYTIYGVGSLSTSLPSLPAGYRWTKVSGNWYSATYQKERNRVEELEAQGFRVDPILQNFWFADVYHWEKTGTQPVYSDWAYARSETVGSNVSSLPSWFQEGAWVQISDTYAVKWWARSKDRTITETLPASMLSVVRYRESHGWTVTPNTEQYISGYRTETYQEWVPGHYETRTRTVTKYRTETYQSWEQVGTRTETYQVWVKSGHWEWRRWGFIVYPVWVDTSHWETRTRTVPVYGWVTRTRQVPYQVTETYQEWVPGHWETRTKQVPVYSTRVVSYTVSRTETVYTYGYDIYTRTLKGYADVYGWVYKGRQGFSYQPVSGNGWDYRNVALESVPVGYRVFEHKMKVENILIGYQVEKAFRERTITIENRVDYWPLPLGVETEVKVIPKNGFTGEVRLSSSAGALENDRVRLNPGACSVKLRLSPSGSMTVKIRASDNEGEAVRENTLEVRVNDPAPAPQVTVWIVKESSGAPLNLGSLMQASPAIKTSSGTETEPEVAGYADGTYGPVLVGFPVTELGVSGKINGKPVFSYRVQLETTFYGGWNLNAEYYRYPCVAPGGYATATPREVLERALYLYEPGFRPVPESHRYGDRISEINDEVERAIGRDLRKQLSDVEQGQASLQDLRKFLINGEGVLRRAAKSAISATDARSRLLSWDPSGAATEKWQGSVNYWGIHRDGSERLAIAELLASILGCPVEVLY